MYKINTVLDITIHTSVEKMQIKNNLLEVLWNLKLLKKNNYKADFDERL